MWLINKLLSSLHGHGWMGSGCRSRGSFSDNEDRLSLNGLGVNRGCQLKPWAMVRLSRVFFHSGSCAPMLWSLVWVIGVKFLLLAVLVVLTLTFLFGYHECSELLIDVSLQRCRRLVGVFNPESSLFGSDIKL